MKLKGITLSGVNEQTNPYCLSVLKDKRIELGIQVSQKKGASGTLRYQWLDKVHEVYRYSPLSFALHINSTWVEDICHGNIPLTVQEFLAWRCGFEPFFQRIQLNFKVGREEHFDTKVLIETMKSPVFRKVRFILPWNDANAKVLQEVHEAGLSFDCLYDNSHGEGVTASSYKAPAFDGVFQGYSGGLSPENVVGELQKIATVVPENTAIWIDAEGKLKGPDGYVTLERCLDFVYAIKHAGF